MKLLAMFLVLGFYTESGRLHVINNNCVIVVSGHRAIHERITEDVELIEIIQVFRRWGNARDNRIEDYSYNPRTFGHSNSDYLEMLDQRNDLSSHRVVLMARLLYVGGKLVGMEVWDQDR